MISNNEARLNHALGILVGPSARVLNNNAHHNGQLGIGVPATTSLWRATKSPTTTWLTSESELGGGGAKLSQTDRLTVRAIFSHHNVGPGLWTDTDNINTLYENNTVEDNTSMGILHEISYAAVIRTTYCAP